jgi:organic radical activating enzyme
VTRYIETFFRHKVLLLTPLVLTLLLSAWYVKTQPTTYTTSMKVWFDNELPGPGYLDQSTNNGTPPATQAQTLLTQLLSTHDFLVKAAQRGPASAWIRTQADPNGAADQVVRTIGSSVTAFGVGPQVLSVSMTGGDPSFIPKQLGAVVDEYFDYVKTLRSSRIQAAVDYYKPRLDAATSALQSSRADQIAYLGSHPGTGAPGTTDPQYNAIAAEVATAQNQYDDAQKNYTQADQALTTEQAQASSHVIDPPAAAFGSSKKKAAIFAGAAGLFFGLLVGLLGLIALTAADTAARRREDVETTTGDLQVVATIAEFPRERERTPEARSR